MPLHQSNVNFQNLIQDLAEMYTFDIAEVVASELIANSLDSKATKILIDYVPRKKILIITDNGEGMSVSQFAEYHDFAAGLKIRGSGIGFAGLGAKISFNIANCVITQTKSRTFSGGSEWYLETKKNLIWKDLHPKDLENYGTKVEVRFREDVEIPYLSTSDIVNLIKRQYLPLTNERFLELYDHLGIYSRNLRFTVNGEMLNPISYQSEYSLDKVKEINPKRAGKNIGYGVFALSAKDYPLGQSICGVLLTTHGKVIKADLFNQFPANLTPKIFGVVEIPEFINFLTTSKTDFIKKRKYKDFESYYNPIREQFISWMIELGIQQEEVVDIDEAKKLERELNKLLDMVPELTDFFGFRSRKNILAKKEDGNLTASTKEGIDITFPIGEIGSTHGKPGPVDVGNQPGEATVSDSEDGKIRAQPISRTGKRGPKINFSARKDRVDMSWIDGNNVIINSEHPSFIKTRSNSSTRRLYCLFAIASAVQKFISNTDEQSGLTEELMFIDRMMAAWGKI